MKALRISVGASVDGLDKLWQAASEESLKLNVSFLRKNVSRIWLVFEGDFGGQIYLTARLDKLGDGACFVLLLDKLDTAAWSTNDGDGKSWHLFLTDHPRRGVNGGMGGGRLRAGVWLHKEV